VNPNDKTRPLAAEGTGPVASTSAGRIASLSNGADNPAAFDAAHAVEFLDEVFGDVNSGRIGISHLTPHGGMRSEHFQWFRSAAAKAQEWDSLRPPGIYFRATMLPPNFQGKRGGADDSHALPFLWADLDYGTVGHKAPAGTVLPPDEEAARKVIADLPTPTLIVHSGGGLYPIWQYQQPIYLTSEAKRAEAKNRSQRWQNLIKARAEALGWHYGSGVGDLARVLRLPGTINRKEGLGRPCRVIEERGEVLPSW
jgi:hypothetical protein